MDKSQPLASDITSLNGKMKTLEVVIQADVYESTPYKRVVQVPLTSSGFVSFEVPTESKWTTFNLQVSHFKITYKNK